MWMLLKESSGEMADKVAEKKGRIDDGKISYRVTEKAGWGKNHLHPEPGICVAEAGEEKC